MAQISATSAPPGEVPMGDYLLRHLPADVKEKIALVITDDEEEAQREIVDSEVLFGWLTPDLLRRAKKLRWVQSTNASQENHLFPEFAASDIVLTSTAGIYDDVIADHVYAMILGLTRQLTRFIRNQEKAFWERRRFDVSCLAGKTLGVIGLGGIGGEVARRGPAFKMRVVATRAHPDAPKPDYIDRVWGPDGLGDLLAQSDFAVVCTPETPRTRKMIGREELATMKRTACIFNVGRGAVIDMAALTEALQQGTIAGAGLDCFEIEPLPSDHPLWAMENVIITPHMAGQHTPHTKRVDVFLDNLTQYLEGRPLMNVVDKTIWR
ncbi:MAG: D-2-hydroxyacid dehydrogenase [Bacteroidetes bacterium]|nr:D-2-hydroxyacid dehydrogenase [Bacteroidota bacterium]MCL5025096.1 D-2-hydroxyacid dehydrogenase [Chloroflexota bacterium]